MIITNFGLNALICAQNDVLFDSVTQTVKLADTLKIDALQVVKVKNPLISGLFSSVLPGSGQFYTNHPIRGGLFLATEVLLGGVAIRRYLDYDYYKPLVSWAKDSVDRYEQIFKSAVVLTLADTTGKKKAHENYEVQKYNDHKRSVQLVHAVGWFAGCHLYNICDAIDKSNYFRDELPRKPSVAGLLSAVPCLGLGQIYNGEISRAGLVIMAQSGLLMMTYNYNDLKVRAEHQMARIDADASMDKSDKYKARSRWAGDREFAFRTRNTFAWYGLMLYGYGIVDAIVDAHLHNASSKMRLTPDLEVTEQGISLKVTTEF